MSGLRRENQIIGFVMLMIFVCAFSVGALVYNLFFINIEKDNEFIARDAKEVIGMNVTQVEEQEDAGGDLAQKKLYGLQCGVYKNYEYAKEAYLEFKELGVPFIVEDGKDFRVIFGIYDKELADKVVMMLNENDIDVYPFEIAREIHNRDEAVQYEIELGLLKLIWRMGNKGLQTISTESYKSWVEKQEVSKGGLGEEAAKTAMAIEDEMNVKKGEDVFRQFYYKYYIK